MVSEVTVHGPPALLFWAWDGAKHHDREAWQRKTVHLIATRKTDEGLEPGRREPGTTHPSKGISQCTASSDCSMS